MGVSRQFGNRKGMRLFAGSFPQRVSGADVNWSSPAQIWKREVNLSIAAISCAEQREKRLVLIDW